MNNTVIVKQWATVGNGVTIKYQIIHAVTLINLIESSLAPPSHPSTRSLKQVIWFLRKILTYKVPLYLKTPYINTLNNIPQYKFEIC